MDLRFSEEVLMVRDSFREMLARECSSEFLRRPEAQARERLWQHIVDMGLLGVLAPEEVGGAGLGVSAFALLAEEAGYAALPLPFTQTAGLAVRALGGHKNLLEEIVRGGKRVAMVHPLNPQTPYAEEAEIFLFLEEENRLSWAVAEKTHCVPTASLDPLMPLCDVSCAQKTPLGVWGECVILGAVLGAAELLGLARRMLDMAVAYAKQREQFGRPIGSFQAIKHQLADVCVALEFAAPVVLWAAERVGARDEAVRVAHAVIAAHGAARQAALTALQVHGAMGYTWEADLHFFMKRAFVLMLLWGGIPRQRRLLRAALGDKTLPVGAGNTFGI